MATRTRTVQVDYPLKIRAKDMKITEAGELLIVGRPAQIVRLFLLQFPERYARTFVPYLRAREKSFKPDELWIDAQGRIHITNKRIVARARHHMAAAKKEGRR